MNYIAEEIEMSNLNYLEHIGVGHLDGGHSGRWPWGSGESPFQHTKKFFEYVNEKRSENFTWTDPKTGFTYTGDTAIAKSLKMSTGDFRALYTLTNNDVKLDLYSKAIRMRNEGKTYSDIAKELGLANESTVRTWLSNANFEKSLNQAKATAELIKKQIDEKGMIDVGKGSEIYLGVSEKTLNDALVYLKMQGYEVYGGRVPQATNPGKLTTLKVACPPGYKNADIFNYGEIHQIKEFTSYDDGKTFKPSFQFPESMDSSRLSIKYSEEGGLAKDGVIELRRGVDDLYLGDGVNYSQVRILVDGSHYLKGMAVYADDLPDGIDVRFNTNKSLGTPLNKVLKPVKTKIDENGNEVVDKDNPFGALIKENGGQREYMGEDGKMHLSLINKRAEEGDWADWSNKVPSQFLSKQPAALIDRQLKLTINDKKAEYDEIMSLTNPTIKRKLLDAYALDCDKAAEDLKAASLPGQKYEVLLPLTSIKDNECYAPNYENGTKLALVRFPHGGTFEIPIVTVNNKNEEGTRVITKNAKDAVGISKKTADRLSGADFDGDTVMTIPLSNKVNIKSTPALDDLKDFDNKAAYPGYEGMKKMKDTQKQMGVVSNLISDMTLKGASPEELAKAVKHSMVVIDAEKHNLDWKKSEKDNDIKALKRRYQGHYDENGKYHEGASTLISKAKSEVTVDKRVGQPIVNKDGSLSYKVAKDSDLYYTKVYDASSKKWKSTYKKEDGLYYKDNDGGLTKVKSSDKTQTFKRTETTTAMANTNDARTLISDRNTKTERAYAEFANTMKSYANEARRQSNFEVGRLQYNSDAAKKYANEVTSLNNKHLVAKSNAPKERQAQLIAASEVSELKKNNPDMTNKEIKKANQVAITKARARVGIEKREDRQINISDKEWEAIQKGAISDSKLSDMLRYTDLDSIRARATPKTTNEISKSQIRRIQAYADAGYTNAEIAIRLGVSKTTVSKYASERG